SRLPRPLSPPDSAAPLASTAAGRLAASAARHPELIVAQAASPVDWEACMAELRARGVTATIEVAPAGTLTGLAKRELKGIALANLNTPDDLEPARALVREHAGTAATDQEA